MSKLEFIEVHNPIQIDRVAKLADTVWHEHYKTILSSDQIDYMVENFQSAKAIFKQLTEENYSYYILSYDGYDAGYLGIQPQENDELYLSKLYILRDFRGNKISSEVFTFLEALSQDEGYKKVWLTVNKYNENSVNVYKHLGMEIVKEQKTDIGNGYVMDDYVMEKTF